VNAKTRNVAVAQRPRDALCSGR